MASEMARRQDEEMYKKMMLTRTMNSPAAIHEMSEPIRRKIQAEIKYNYDSPLKKLQERYVSLWDGEYDGDPETLSLSRANMIKAIMFQVHGHHLMSIYYEADF